MPESETESGWRGGVVECFGEEVAVRERLSAIAESELGFTKWSGRAKREN